MEQDHDAIRGPFAPLAYEYGLSWLVDQGAATRKHLERHMRNDPPGQLPFVPHLGPLRVNPKAQVEHRAFRNYRGFATFPAQAVDSSPTALRLIPREDERVSEHALVDTYLGDRQRILDGHIAREGSTDYLVGVDESAWHFALSIEPRQRITITPDSDEARSALQGARISARPYIHVYPYGPLTVILGIAVEFPCEVSVSDTIVLLRQLIGRRGTPNFLYSMRGVDPSNANGLLLALANRVETAIEPAASPSKHAIPDYSVSVAADSHDISDQELSGLLTLDDRYEIFKDDWVQAQASLYGRYQDRVAASRTALAVATSPIHFSPSGRRRFFWRLHAIRELALCQTRTLGSINHRLKAVGTRGGPDERLTSRLLAVAEHLIDFPRGLPAHHRKWFYECRRVAANGRDAVDEFYRAVAQMHDQARHAAIMARMDNARNVSITLNHSQIGALNLGTVIGDLEGHLSAVSGAERDEARDALAKLAQAVVDEESLTQEQQEGLLQSLDLLAEEAAKDPDRRRTAVVQPVLDGMAGRLAAAGDLAAVWTVVGPVILSFFA